MDDEDEITTGSFGWFAKRDKNFIYLSHFFDGVCHELGSPFTAIPHGMIKDEYELEIKDGD